VKYFWGEKPLKADIERHRQAEKKLDEDIAKYEGKDDPMSIASLRTLRHFRAQLLQSKADVVSKIGKKVKS
jgi:polygalacturonase